LLWIYIREESWVGLSASALTTDLISKAMIKAYNLRRPHKGLVFHSDRGSQYTSRRYRQLIEGYGVRASMGDVGACWDNAVVERFFGSLKHDWIFKIEQPTRELMTKDVAAYMRYYNLEGCILRTVISHLLTMKVL
jgi:putative transposase